MANVRLKIAYDGRNYLGWQKTPTGPSIEGTLQNVLETILQEPIKLQAASRTDAGVHAQGQVVNFFSNSVIPLRNIILETTVQSDKMMQDFELESLLTGAEHSHKVKAAPVRRDYGSKDCVSLSLSTAVSRINALLPKDISVLSYEIADDDFHPTTDSIGKEYHYHIWNDPVMMPQERHTHWHVSTKLNVQLMREAASHLIGEHDFAAFCNTKKNEPYESTVREITSIVIEESQQRITIKIKGKSFLYKMVRNIVGTLVYIGCGKINDIRDILLQKNRTLAGITAPAHGLTLFDVFYSFHNKN